MTRLALISDTHGLLRPEIPDLIRDCDAILHAGDVGDPTILEELSSLAPVHAIRGNVDRGELATRLPADATLEFEGERLHLVHDIDDLEIDPVSVGVRLVVFGHSHRPEFRERDGVAFLNPGSVGPRRFTLPISFARVEWGPDGFTQEFIRLDA